MKRESNITAPMQFVGPNPNKIPCTDCIFREKDCEDGAVRASCEVFPNHKSVRILFDGEKCDYYQSEKAAGRNDRPLFMNLRE